MKIAFYAPLKSPNHPVPSGDRLMARLLIEALRRCGHDVEIASEFRSFSADPSKLTTLKSAAEAETRRLGEAWQRHGLPDLWFCYHPYYKSPDLLGPDLCARYGIAYATAEASYSERRNSHGWQAHQALLADALTQACVNIAFTERDLYGIRQSVPGAVLERLPAFIDTTMVAGLAPRPQMQPFRFVTVAMMRSGDKMSSYAALAAALRQLEELPDVPPWALHVVGDGPARAEVQDLFAGFDPGRIVWHGQLSAHEIGEVLCDSALYLWPGHGEAYGLAYLEAQAAGLPVVAECVAGVPEVVVNGRTGHLTPAGDTLAFAGAVRRLMLDTDYRAAMATAARQFVLAERSLERAADRIAAILQIHGTISR
ncbi:glycosyltransferase family 4 protein [Neorhizobium sp. NPDC001467]|uniref:glycosyltransferase family 4 protein n=1 Tax=Neorhizobium sp. NPDC001467 TaxID=3390595 RepID=UPI003D061A06